MKARRAMTIEIHPRRVVTLVFLCTGCRAMSNDPATNGQWRSIERSGDLGAIVVHFCGLTGTWTVANEFHELPVDPAEFTDLTPARKAEIDAMSYTDMLYRWRYAPVGKEPLFEGDTGRYFELQMKLKGATSNRVAASKMVDECWSDRSKP